jgi:flagellar transcriptional activator FlhD
MKNDRLMEEIRDLNLAYLLLAQNLIHADRAEALYRLGLSDEAADRIGDLSSAQLLKIASSNQLMCRFRFDDGVVWNLLASHARDRQAAGMHASILMAGRPAELAAAA